MPPKVALWLGSTPGWVDITADARQASAGGGITITRGRQNEGQQADPGSASLVLNNRLGKYSPRNPRSAYYGLIGRNTPIRITEGPDTAYLRLPGLPDSWAQVADTAALDVTGDLDVRVDMALWNWTDPTRAVALANRYVSSGNNRAWAFYMDPSGKPVLLWSPDGTTASWQFVFATVPITVPSSRRLAVRATLDVDNGSSGWTVRFYTADTIAGPWTQLGSGLIGSPVTSIANVTAPLNVGIMPDLTSTQPVGECYGVEVRSGGTLVANGNFAAQTPGLTGFTDSAGRTWVLASDTELVHAGTRLRAEVSSWPSRWDLSGNNVWVPVEAAGILRRLGQGASPLRSPIYRRSIRYNPSGYWPLEDGSDAEYATSALPNASPADVVNVQFAGDDTLRGSESVLKLSDATSRVSAGIPAMSGHTDWSVAWFFRLNAVPAADTRLMTVYSTGTVRRWEITATPTAYRFEGYNTADVLVDSAAFSYGGTEPNQWIAMQLGLTQNGGNVDWVVLWHPVGSGTFAGSGSNSYAGSIGSASVWQVPGSTGYTGGSLGHVMAAPSALPFVTYEFADASNGYAGETAADRIVRLCAEQDVNVMVIGARADTEPMGPQRSATFVELLADAAGADHGILSEARDVEGFVYRTRLSLENQTPVALDYAAGHISPPFEPLDDDDATRNDVEVSRVNGASARAVLETGPLSVLSPPDGVGRYDTSVTVNVASDARLRDHAGWLLHLGTWDESRYPRITINLAAPAWQADPDLASVVAALDSGDRITVDNLPDWLPPGPADVIVQGYTERYGDAGVGGLQRTITWNATPAGPWDVATADGEARVPADGSTLAATLAEGGMSLLLASTPANGPWTTDPADFPLDVRVGGERVTATAIGPGINDPLDGTVADGWGTTATGQPWLLSGTASDFSVSGGFGRHSLPANDVLRVSYVDVDAAQFDIMVPCRVTELATGAQLVAEVVARWSGIDDHYRFEVGLQTSGSVDLRIARVSGGTRTVLGSAAGVTTYAPSASVWVRCQGDGSRLRMAAWPHSGTWSGVWAVSVTDSTHASGAVGVLSLAAGGNTNAKPVQILYGEFIATTPQMATLSARGVNGVTREWPVGTEVDVWQPAIAPL